MPAIIRLADSEKNEIIWANSIHTYFGKTQRAKGEHTQRGEPL